MFPSNPWKDISKEGNYDEISMEIFDIFLLGLRVLLGLLNVDVSLTSLRKINVIPVYF